MKPQYAVQYQATQTQNELPSQMYPDECEDPDFECWIDDGIVYYIISLIRHGWKTISCCSGLGLDHGGIIPPTGAHLVVRSLSRGQRSHIGKLPKKVFRVETVYEGVYKISIVSPRGDVHTNSLWKEMFDHLMQFGDTRKASK